MRRFFLYLCGFWCIPLMGFTEEVPLPYAYVNPYNVDGIEITLKSAHASRLQAISLAQRQGFDILLTRFEESTSQVHLKTLPDHQIETLIQDVEVTQEKITPDHYKGTFLVRFKEAAIKKIISGDDKTKPTFIKPIFMQEEWVIIPVIEDSDGTLLWEEENALLSYFHDKSDLLKDLHLTLPLADLEDIQALNATMALTLNKRNILTFLERYKVPRALVFIYKRYTHTLSLFCVNIAGINPLLEQVIPESELYEKLPMLLRSVLDNKNTTIQEAFEPVTVLIPLNDSKQWQLYENKLKNSPWVKEVTLLTLTPGGATFQVHVKNQLEGLTKVFPHATFKGQWPSITLIQGLKTQ